MSNDQADVQVNHVINPTKDEGAKDTCKYNRSEKCNESFSLDTIGPKGLCLDLYHSAYPYCLALLYGAEFSWEKDKDAVNAQCPAPDGNVHYEVRRIPYKEEITSKGCVKTCKVIIKITHIEKNKGLYDNCGECCSKQVLGKEYEFNQGDLLDQMCPASFYNIYPTMYSVISGGKPRWTRNDKVYGQCPDNISKLLFEISKNGPSEDTKS